MSKDLTFEVAHPPGAAASRLSMIWTRRRGSAGAGILLAALSGLLMAAIMPRGPVTTVQALLVMSGGLLIGLAAGLLLRTRWAILLAPLAQLVLFELGRIGTKGPTVDSFELGSTYGILAFLAGRGFYGLVGLLPMMLGAAYGAGLARRRWPAHPNSSPSWPRQIGLYSRRGAAGLATLALVGLAALIAQPASTPPIHGADGKPLPGSVASLEKVQLGGHEQWVMIHGYSAANPILLYLAGGPGQSDLVLPRVLYNGLAEDMTIVAWDQRGTGKSYPALDPATLTLERAVSDTVELTNYLRQRFHQPKIYLLGESWGTVLGVLAVQRHPELYYGYIGSGQMVNIRETDQQIYDQLLAYAARIHDNGMAAQLRAYGPPPYKTSYANGFVLEQYSKLEEPYNPPREYEELGSSAPAGFGPFPGLMGSEYSVIDKVNNVRGLLDMFSVMYPQLQGIDFRRDATSLQVPVYILDGKHELSARRNLALEWFNQLQAPNKRLFTFENAGHATAMEQLQPLHQLIKETVLPETRKGSS